MAEKANLPQVDISPTYDLLQSLGMVVSPPKKGRWVTWVSETAHRLQAEQPELWQKIRRWFGGDSAPGGAYLALIPLLPQPAGVEELLRGITGLSLADFLRVAVTTGPMDPETPLDAETLLSLEKDHAGAKAFVDRYLRFTGKRRTQFLQILVEPEAARTNLRQAIQGYHEHVYTGLEPQICDERLQAASLLQEMLYQPSSSPVASILAKYDLHNFSPVVLTPSVFREHGASSYIHETRHSLFDQTSYEPLILIVGTQKLLAPAPQRGRATATAAITTDPAKQWARLFAAMGDATRLRLIHLLAKRPHYEQELAVALNLSGATISHHLKILFRVGLVRIERKAHRTYLALQNELLAEQFRESQRYFLDQHDQGKE